VADVAATMVAQSLAAWARVLIGRVPFSFSAVGWPVRAKKTSSKVGGVYRKPVTSIAVVEAVEEWSVARVPRRRVGSGG